MLLKQREVSITRGHKTRASMDCIAEGIPAFQYAYIHWYRHVPTKAPERVLYIGDGAASYDDNSYRNKYSSSKKGTNVCTLTINDINSSDEGAYYCAYWHFHRTCRWQAACTESSPWGAGFLSNTENHNCTFLPLNTPTRLCWVCLHDYQTSRKAKMCYNLVGIMLCAAENQHSCGWSHYS